MHSNISIFVPHVGCPHKCAFCDQRTITGEQKLPHKEDVERACMQALGQVKDISDTEIAFFGGSFTAIPRDYMLELLSAAYKFVGDGKFKGIRLSTRPDYINREVLDILKKYGVTSIELGAQSMSDEVLEANERGHTAEDVRKASRLIREYGFELGLQMMVGLYKSGHRQEDETFNEIMAIHPDTVRIYPVVILKNTRLAELLASGEYKPLSFDEVLSLSTRALGAFTEAGIKVIKCGLHASEFVEKDMVGGFYHPAFRELCENRIYLMKMESALHDANSQGTTPKDMRVTFAVGKGCISKAVGQKRANLQGFEKHGIKVKITEDKELGLYEVRLIDDVTAAHKFSIYNRKQLGKSKKCGCFYCCEIFTPDKITGWINEGCGTALCPYCGIDSVIGDASGYPITKEFMQSMHERWF
ncbi:radical SAM protein [Ruminococcus albus SY3]|uniref:Radical SAM protein n=1 Tax=Ruminococcus albus SY3 TaxID=1341156 RepID=A0A011V1N1_RUMAL|nr:radical SAM protein [Ruminococcus albus]EXM39367.1 radical SAM protein [Ruminococcus albus SY3]